MARRRPRRRKTTDASRARRRREKERSGLMLGGVGAYVGADMTGDRIARAELKGEATTFSAGGREIPKFTAAGAVGMVASLFLKNPTVQLAVYGTSAGVTGASQGIASYKHRIANPAED